MTNSKEVEIYQAQFSAKLPQEISQIPHVVETWPIVYILENKSTQEAYIGESTNAKSRLQTHLRTHDMTDVHLICSNKFNKSAALDTESKLIQYLASEGRLSLLNSNNGIQQHNYYQKAELYSEIFEEIWNLLISRGVARKSLDSIQNSDLFKYSPYKSLTSEQLISVEQILEAILDPSISTIIVKGGAGTGKSVLITYLFKLLNDHDADELAFDSDLIEITNLKTKVQARYPDLKMSLVIPMTSFRSTIKKVFQHNKNLTGSMVVSPNELARSEVNIAVVDEAHRLKRRQNLVGYASFDQTCEDLGLDKKTASELDWVQQQSEKQILFYDSAQSIKPTDTRSQQFDQLLLSPKTKFIELRTQLRSLAGDNYSVFLESLLAGVDPIHNSADFYPFELKIYDDIRQLVAEIHRKNSNVGLSRLVAGFAWPWISRKNHELFDIEIDSLKLRWNTTENDWINSENSVDEVGCIHTTQGYDLNYVGLIIGNDLTYNPETKSIEIDSSQYFDRNGKNTATPEELSAYIKNIYRTLMLRPIKGLYLYICDPELRKYFSKFLPQVSNQASMYHILDAPQGDKCVPFFDMDVAAGNFGNPKSISQSRWIQLPDGIPHSADLFACQVTGESMNRTIPNGSICIFKTDSGGSRNGKIVLVELQDELDPETGFAYTVKEYQSTKIALDEENVQSNTILLKPKSWDSAFLPIILSPEISAQVRIVGIFQGII